MLEEEKELEMNTWAPSENHHHDCCHTLYSPEKLHHVMVLKFEISQEDTILNAQQIMAVKK